MLLSSRFLWVGTRPFCFAEPFPFTVDTAAVFLSVEVKFFADPSALVIAGPQVLESEPHPLFLGDTLTDLLQELLILVWADEQRSGKSIKTLQLCYCGRHRKAQTKAIAAAFPLMSHHSPKIVNDIVSFESNQSKVHSLSILLQSLQAVLVLGQGMDVGVVPEKGDLNPLLPPVLKATSGAGSATSVEKQVSHSCYNSCPWGDCPFLDGRPRCS